MSELLGAGDTEIGGENACGVTAFLYVLLDSIMVLFFLIIYRYLITITCISF